MSGLLDDSEQRQNRPARVYRVGLTLCVIAATLLIALDTLPSLHNQARGIIPLLQTFFFGVLVVDFVLRSIAAATGDTAQEDGLKSYWLSAMGVIDLASSLPFWMNLSGMGEGDLKTVLGILAFFKLARYSPALLILRDVVISERKPLLAALYLMLVLTFSLSTLMYFVERGANPMGFQSIPHAMWWSIVTLATLGYGDVIPVTPLGKVLGGMAAIMGFGMFALPAGILANGFAEEIRRIRLVTNWNLVAKVPLFSGLDAGAITEISRLLSLRRFIRNETIIKQGDRGDSMYFILEGEVEIISGEQRTKLAAGDFFGEIALLRDVRRTATAKAAVRCECLELTAYDFRRYIAKRPELMEAIHTVAERRYAIWKETQGTQHLEE